MSEPQRREFTAEFMREAVGLIASSGRTIRQVADGLGFGLSTLTRWKRVDLSQNSSASLNSLTSIKEKQDGTNTQ